MIEHSQADPEKTLSEAPRIARELLVPELAVGRHHHEERHEKRENVTFILAHEELQRDERRKEADYGLGLEPVPPVGDDPANLVDAPLALGVLDAVLLVPLTRHRSVDERGLGADARAHHRAHRVESSTHLGET